MMKVYFAPQSRAVRTVWLLEEIGQPYELVRFELGQKEMRGPEYAKLNPNGRVPTLVDGDIAGAVRFLAGPESSWVTGQCLTVDGGHTLRRFPDMEPLARAVAGEAVFDDARAGRLPGD